MESILIVDDEKSILDSLGRAFKEEGYKVLMAETGEEALNKIGSNEISLMLLDLRLPDLNGLDVLKKAKTLHKEMLVIVITGFGTIETAVEAIKSGAYDYIKKPFKLDSIKLIVKLALETQILKKEVRDLRREFILGSEVIVGNSSKILEILSLIKDLSRKETTSILLIGETGTGKELMAKAIHTQSQRSNNRFVQINCAAIPPQLLESEFFGHEKGAFTDAKERRVGLLELAQEGTVLLDEIADMDLHLQAKLLNVLDERKFRRIGGKEKIDFNARIISSTNIDLDQAVKEGKFRADLYYRLNVLPILIPPLRERGDDVVLLANHFMKELSRKFNRRFDKISDDSIEILKRYSFPGNVRELKNMIERVLLIYDEKTILPKHLPFEIRKVDREGPQLGVDKGWCFDSIVAFGREGVDFNSAMASALNQVRRRAIDRAMELTDGNKRKAAKLLRLSRSALGRHMKHFEKIR
jgi:two-component system response regulator AtoC